MQHNHHKYQGQAWQYTSVIPELGRLRQGYMRIWDQPGLHKPHLKNKPTDLVNRNSYFIFHSLQFLWLLLTGNLPCILVISVTLQLKN